MRYFESRGERYSVDSENNIGRPQIGIKASGQWKLLGVFRLNNFGRVVDRAELDYLIEPGGTLSQTELLFYKNGKPKWFVRDYDHGTLRQWGAGITGVGRICLKSHD